MNLRRILSDIDYAQRRLLEIRTGQVFTVETRRRLARAEVRRLEDALNAPAAPDTVRL